MFIGIVCLIIALLGGALFTYTYEDESSLPTRIVEGAFIGWAMWGLIGFLFASYAGLSIWVSLLAACVIFLPFVLFVWLKKRNILLRDISDVWRSMHSIRKSPVRYLLVLLLYIVAIIGIWMSLAGGSYMRDGGVQTTSVDNYADFTLHAGIINGFVYGKNFPPQHPDYAGSRLTYPFLADFIIAMEMIAGFSLMDAIFLQRMVFLMFFLFLLQIWVRNFMKNWAVVGMVIALIFLNGGLGWVMAITEFPTSNQSLGHYLFHLPHDYTSFGETIRWVNSIIFWFITMPSMLLGIPLFIIITNIWWRAIHSVPSLKFRHWKRIFAIPPRIDISRMAAAGCIAALLPLSHGHSLLTLLGVGLCMALLFPSVILWVIFFGVSGVLSLPQFIWLTTDTASSIGNFFGVIWGWNQVEKNILWFWLVNTGLFIPLSILAIVKKGILDRTFRKFYLPFILCLLIPNFIRLAPWEWDNMKVLAYWYIFSTIPVALCLAYFWKKGWMMKIVVVVIFVSMILAGSLDNWRAWTGTASVEIYSPQTLELAEYIKRELPPRSVIVTALIHNNAVLMSGRQSYYGYPGRIWSHGLPWLPREEAVKKIYEGSEEAETIFKKDNIDYVFVGPAEINWTTEQKTPLNEEFFTKYPLIAEIADTKIYHVKQSN